MTALSHVDPNYGSVFSIEAVNEQIMDATLTPGYGECWFDLPISLTMTLTGFVAVSKNFVQVVRAVELTLGIPIPGIHASDDYSKAANVTDGMRRVSDSSLFNSEVRKALAAAIIPTAQIMAEFWLSPFPHHPPTNPRESLVTKSVYFLVSLRLQPHSSPASWTSTGNSIIPAIPKRLRKDLRHTTIIFTTRKFTYSAAEGYYF
jgi:hypothetical protein